MVGWGIFLIILGAGSLLLPMLGFQFRLMEIVEDYQPWAGIVVAIIGAALVVYGMGRRPATTVAAPPSATNTGDSVGEDPNRRP